MQGQLFTQDFLTRGILETPAHQALDDAALAGLRAALAVILAGRTAQSTLNEAQTESEIIAPVLLALGWEDTLPQVNLSGKRREDVPDWLLFANPAAKAAALPLKDDQRYRHGLALLEAKRWLRPLDRGDAFEATDPDAPSSQMLRYLSRADVVSDRAVKWGVLTNGAVWRLYWQDARSRSEDFFEIDLTAALELPGHQRHIEDFAPAHALRLFALFFGRAAFLPQDWDSTGRSFHAYALNEARLYEERVSQDLGARVFADVFPQLADALRRDDLDARTHTVGYGQFTRQQFTPDYLEEVREAALVMLYRLLFLFYAEDRHLLPVHDPRYAPYSVRRIREEVRDKVDAGASFSSTMPRIWLALRGVFGLINKGDDDIGMPAYNGGLFNRARAPLLERTDVPDKVMAPIIDALSRRTEDLLRGWINYRDLAVAHLGSIYERLLEYSLVHRVQARDDYKDKAEVDRIEATPSSFARKVSGSYYTHDDLVRLVLRESVGRLVATRVQRFEAQVKKWARKASLNPPEWEQLDALDPASSILELKVCDPAMGSGHFLVALVDELADRVLEAMAAATLLVGAQPWAAHLEESGRPWQSPLLARISHIRRSIKTTAHAHGWAVTDAQLDDRHIVRRMILKKTIFGVDKNPMAVELAKTALWLHTFTVGAPLSFLDHHLKTGDSLHGERLAQVQQGLQHLGALLLQSEFDRLALASAQIAQVADLTDVDIAEAALSRQLAQDAGAKMAPILSVLDFWRALRWLVPGWPVASAAQLQRLLAGDAPRTQALRSALQHLLSPGVNLAQVLAVGTAGTKGAGVAEANALIAEARALARRETFFHWWTQFPTVFGDAGKGASDAGFDAVIGNPPWDRIKLQEVEWFAERDAAIAQQSRASDRKRLIVQEKAGNTPLWQSYQAACERAEANARVLGNGRLGSGDFPLLGGGDVNLYSLFVERAQSLINPEGVVALVAPSGIAADKGAAPFFRSISSTGRLYALYDFENRKVFFPDVHASFKFCVLVFGRAPRMAPAEGDAEPLPLPSQCAFYLHSLEEIDAPGRLLSLSAADFARVNPNTGAAPIFRSQRDADITLALYARHPVLVRYGALSASTGQAPEVRAWPVKYATMFHMTNDSALFLTAPELQAQGWERSALNRWTRAGAVALPLYEGKMVQMYDHRAADVVVNSANLHRAAQPQPLADVEKASPDRYPVPQYYVEGEHVTSNPYEWALGFKEISAPTNARSMIASVFPAVAFGNKLPLLIPQGLAPQDAAAQAALLAANLNSFAFDFVLRQKLQGQTINLFILEQLPVIAPERFNAPLPPAFAQAMREARLMNGHHANPTVADFVLPQVLALCYTAHDLAPFARDLGYVDAAGAVLPPFAWDEGERHARMAALDALFFYLYGLDGDDAAYMLQSFPIVREQEERAFGRYRTQEEVLRVLALLQG